jgi:adenosylcobyric acid synthase
VAAVRFPRISNFTDLDALAVEPAVRPRWVDTAPALGRPDLLILPGTKATVADLGWLRQTGLADAIAALAGDPGGRTTILGICGGYQMLGTLIDDRVESRPARTVLGLGLLPAETVFEPDKLLRWTTGQGLGVPVRGYEIRHGRTRSAAPWIATDRPGDADEGCQAAEGRVAGTSLHGLLEGDAFRSAFLTAVGRRAGVGWERSGVSFAAAREARFDRLATVMETHLDITALERLIGQAAPVAP